MAEYGISRESIICFAGEDWWYHHPHSKNHLLRRYAKENKVLFVNSLTMGLPSASNPDFFLKIRRKLKSYLRWLRKVSPSMWVLTPITLPAYGSKFGRAINQALTLIQVRLVMFFCGIRRPIVWAAIPSAADLVDHLGAKLVLYQVSDKYDANRDSALSARTIRDFDRHLKERAALVMYSGRKLFEEATEPHRYFLEQAVDFDHFAQPSPVSAPEMKDISHPVLGYVGWMDYVMDTQLIADIAKLRPEWNWVFIGTKSNQVQVTGPNIHFLGSKPYADLPAYIRDIDVFVLPWSQDCAFTSYGSAIKVREYMATGKPVVISPLYEYLTAPGVRIYRSKEEFVSAVEDALHNDTAEQRQLRQSAVRSSTWDTRAKQLGSVIAGLLTAEEPVRYSQRAGNAA